MTKRLLATGCRFAILAAYLLTSAGCIERTITINSEPPGALVHLNDVEVGRTPVTVPFTFYGVYDVKLSKDGYQTLNTSHKAEAPFWEAPGPDLFAELLPGTRHVDLQWQFTLEPAAEPDPTGLVERAVELRSSLDETAPSTSPDATDEPETSADDAPAGDVPQ